MRLRTSLFVVAAASLASAQVKPKGVKAPPKPLAPPVTLHLGDDAPKLTIVKWLKGEPQDDLRDGKVRVFEFWATWCGPCKVGMPHLSELAKRYGDRVAFVGIDSSERVDDVSKPAAFVDLAGDMMAYNVAYATPKGAMTQDWMRAAGQTGIPCAFVVDKRGKIGWIGHPLMGLEEAVDLALADKLDAKAAVAVTKAWEARQARGQAVLRALREAQQAKKTDEALSLNEEVMTNLPYMAVNYAATKYGLLVAKDPEAAHAYGEELLATHANAPLVLQGVAAAIAATDGGDYALGKALLEKSLACAEVSAGTAETMAKLSAKLGDLGEAAKWQERFVQLLGDDPALAKRREAAVKQLAEYKGG